MGGSRTSACLSRTRDTPCANPPERNQVGVPFQRKPAFLGLQRPASQRRAWLLYAWHSSRNWSPLFSAPNAQFNVIHVATGWIRSLSHDRLSTKEHHCSTHLENAHFFSVARISRCCDCSGCSSSRQCGRRCRGYDSSADRQRGRCCGRQRQGRQRCRCRCRCCDSRWYHKRHF